MNLIERIRSDRTLVLVALLATASLQAADRPGVGEEEARKIASAVPSTASARPAKARALLVFTLANGYYHRSIPHGAKAVELMGLRTGAFKATVSDDPAMFEPDALRQFDGICLVSALGEFFLPQNLETLPSAEQARIRQHDAQLKANLAEYIRSGKGLASIHGASYAFFQWPEFGNILGACFDTHPWNAHERIAVKLDEPTHPLAAAFGGKGFEIIDEGYQFKSPYARANLRILLSMDTARMDMNKQNLRPDHDFGLSWVKRYGQGRIFYCALGHNPEEFWNPALLRHFLDGIQFALGDLAAETEPLATKP
jgi:type 1 glutamine amidotransferase